MENNYLISSKLSNDIITSNNKDNELEGSDDDDYHYKNDGSLDMRYSSSKSYVESGGSVWGPTTPSYSNSLNMNNNSYNTSSNSLYFTQYKESNSNISNRKSSNTDIHYTKNVTLDMRFKKSKDLIYPY